MAKKRKLKSRPKAARKEPMPVLPDPRAMERMTMDISRLLGEREFSSLEEANAYLQELQGSGPLPSRLGTTPLERAQDLMYDAWEATGSRRIKLARRALEISPDCADAYVLLAEEGARSPQELLELYQKAVLAGERALGPQAFVEDVGYFWGTLETRPYMRARAGLAGCLWLLGQRQQAIEHYTDMLRLNPNDNQGIRYVLANCLLAEGHDEPLGKLLVQYKGDWSASWLYTRALWLFRQKGNSARARKALGKALEFNPFVPPYLLGQKRFPRRLPELVGIGDEDEAIYYAAEALEGWRRTPGALEWLSVNLPEAR